MTESRRLADMPITVTRKNEFKKDFFALSHAHKNDSDDSNNIQRYKLLSVYTTSWPSEVKSYKEKYL